MTLDGVVSAGIQKRLIDMSNDPSGAAVSLTASDE